MEKRNFRKQPLQARRSRTNRLEERIDLLLNEFKMSKILKENPMIVKSRSLAITNIKLTSDKLHKTSRIVEFAVTGTKGDLYKVVFYFKDKNDIFGDVRIYCSCPYMTFWGPGWNSKIEGFRLWQMGKDLPPDIRDPKRKNKICKHIIAAFQRIPRETQAEFPFVHTGRMKKRP